MSSAGVVPTAPIGEFCAEFSFDAGLALLPTSEALAFGGLQEILSGLFAKWLRRLVALAVKLLVENMSLYFFSSDGGTIKALVGLKAIVLPYENLYEHLQNQASKEVRDPDKLTTELRKVLAKDDLPGFLIEELNHFRCISQSRVASFFHLRQFLVRIGFSETIRGQLQHKKLKSCRAFLEVVKYWIDYAQFHYVAMPWVEAQHLITTCTDKDISSPLYESRIADTLQRLINTNVYRDESFLHVAHKIDALYGRVREVGFQQFISKPDWLGYMSQEKCEKVGVHHAFVETVRTLFVITAWPRLFKILVNNFTAIFPYLIARFRLSSKARNEAGTLPAFLSGDLIIDPIGFATGRSSLPSQEASFAHHGDKARCDLLWHILSRLAVASVLMYVGIETGRMLSYFSELRRFHEEWAPKVAGAMNIVSELDFEIFFALQNAFSFTSINSNIKLEKLVSLGLTVFQKFCAEEKDALLEDTESGLPKALNCTYMQI